MPLDLNKAAQNRQSQSITDCGNDRGQYQGEVSQALAANTAQVIRGQVAQTSQVVGELANQRSMVADYLSDQMAEVLDQGSFWEEVCARTLQKLEGRPQASPFVIEQIELPPMPEAATRYLQSSRQRYSSLPSQQAPALAGVTEAQNRQPEQCEPLNGHRKGAELPPINSNGNSETVPGKGFSGKGGK